MKYILFLLVFLNANYSFGKHVFARLVSSEYSAKYSYQNQSINLIFQTDSTVLLQVGKYRYKKFRRTRLSNLVNWLLKRLDTREIYSFFL